MDSGSFDLTALGAKFGAFVGILVTLVQLLKNQIGLKGRVVLWVSLALGGSLGGLGMQDTSAQVFRALPGWIGGLIVGVLAGAVASGSKDLVTGIQINGAKARANAQAETLPPGEGSAAALPEYRPASIEDVIRATSTSLPAVPGLDDAPLAPQRTP